MEERRTGNEENRQQIEGNNGVLNINGGEELQRCHYQSQRFHPETADPHMMIQDLEIQDRLD